VDKSLTKENELKTDKLPLKPMRRVLVSDGIIEQIKDLILAGTLKPGDQLPSEFSLASQMNVGRSTIREALKVLIHLGFIETKNRVRVVSHQVRGQLDPHAIVERFKDHRNIIEMIEVRKIIEPDIAEMAASRCEKEDIELIQKDVAAMQSATASAAAFAKYDHHFHLHLARGCKNQILIEIIQQIQEMLKETQELILTESKDIAPRSMEFHLKIVEAITAGNPKQAKELMRKHILDIETEMYAILKQQNSNLQSISLH
jgi:GntR family transcriptional repressor for pyruvate dehydrogenase complex